MLAFSNDYYGMIFRATQSVELFCAYYEYYKPFDDAPEYEEYKDVPTWLKVVAGVAVAAVVGLAVGALIFCTGGFGLVAVGGTAAAVMGASAGALTAGAGIATVAATAASDKKNGTESSLGDYIRNAFSASARVGASCIAMTLGIRGAELMAVTVSGGMGLIPVGGTVVTLPQLAGAFLLVAGTVTSQNLLFQVNEVIMFCTSGKEMGAPTGNWLYDSARELTEMASMQFAVYGLMNPYIYQRPKITPLPNETSLTVPGGTGVAVVPNGTAPAVKPPYLPGQYSEYPAAVQGWVQQALPGGSNGIGIGVEGSAVILNHQATSGVELTSIPGKTTTILGRFNSDTGYIISELDLPKSTDFSGNPGGFNLLNTPDDLYTKLGADGFWREYNKPFLDAAISRGDEILMATPINNSTLYLKSGELTGYGREYYYLRSKGYEYVDGKMIFKGEK